LKSKPEVFALLKTGSFCFALTFCDFEFTLDLNYDRGEKA